MAGTTRTRTQVARPQSQKASRAKGAKAGSTPQRMSETRGTERQASAEDPIASESSPGVLGERPEEAPLQARTPRARPSRVKRAKARSTAQRPSENKGTERQGAAEETKRPESSASVLGEARREEVPLRARTPKARPKSERRRRVKEVKARSTAQRPSETKKTKRQAVAEETERPELSASVIDEARPKRTQRGEESETSVAHHQPLERGAEESGHLEPIHEEAPLEGRPLLELYMSNPSFRAKVISHLIRKLR